MLGRRHFGSARCISVGWLGPGSSIFDEQIFALDLVNASGHKSAKDANTVVLVDHVIAGLQVRKDLLRCTRAAPWAAPWLRCLPTEQLCIGDQMTDSPVTMPLPSLSKHALYKGEEFLWGRWELLVDWRWSELLPQFGHTRSLAADNDHLVAEVEPLADAP